MIKHSVKYGESVKSLANRYGVTIEEIQRWNGLDDDDSIYIGQKIMIPMNHYHPSRRDYFAAALGVGAFSQMMIHEPSESSMDLVGRFAVKYADAVIAELDKDKK